MGLSRRDGARDCAAPQYKSVNLFAEGRAAVQVNGQWGVIDRTGQMVIEPTLDAVNAFGSDSYAAVMSGGLWSFIDGSGKFVVEPKFSGYNTTFFGQPALQAKLRRF